MSIYNLQNVAAAYDEKKILADLSFQVSKGELIGILGPNGCGKTTLLRLLAGVLKPAAGSIELLGKPLERYPRRQIARTVSVLPQETVVDFPFTALEVVLMGRAPYLKPFEWEHTEDLEIAQEAMRLTDCEEFANQDIRSLSGGERERVLLARALAQCPQVLLLDEPTTHLDIKHLAETYHLLKRLNGEKCLTILVVLHDLNFAAMTCSRILMLADGGLRADGSPQQVLNAELIEGVYGAPVVMEMNAKSGHPYFFPRL